MSSPITDEDITRVTVISPQRRVDLALPGSVTLGELLPSIVKFAGYEASNATDAVHQWVLQRFGEDPLDTHSSVRQLELSDGETLHLRQRDNAMPDAAFDDVVDAVSTSTAQRPSWQSKHSQRMAIAVLVLAMLGLPMILLFQFQTQDKLQMMARLIAPTPGSSLLLVAILCLFLAFGGVITAISLSRALAERRVSAALSWTAVGLAFLGGFGLLPPQTAPPIRVTLACAAVLLAASASALAAGVQALGLFTAATTAALLLITNATIVLLPAHELAVTSIVIVLMVGLTSMLPTFSYQLARIALPAIPPDAEAMMADETPVQSDIVSRALLADRLLAAFLISTSLTTLLLSMSMVFRFGSLWSISLCGVAAVAMLLRARAFVGLQQRLALLGCGTAVIALVAAMLLGRLAFSPGLQLAIAGVVAVVTVLTLAIYASTQYNKIISPVWGRVGDILEWLAIMAIIPVLLGVLNLYTRFRALGG